MYEYVLRVVWIDEDQEEKVIEGTIFSPYDMEVMYDLVNTAMKHVEDYSGIFDNYYEG